MKQDKADLIIQAIAKVRDEAQEEVEYHTLFGGLILFMMMILVIVYAMGSRVSVLHGVSFVSMALFFSMVLYEKRKNYRKIRRINAFMRKIMLKQER